MTNLKEMLGIAGKSDLVHTEECHKIKLNEKICIVATVDIMGPP
jgi:hypothetical protein